MAPEIVQELPYNETVDLWYNYDFNHIPIFSGHLALSSMNYSMANHHSTQIICTLSYN